MYAQPAVSSHGKTKTAPLTTGKRNERILNLGGKGKEKKKKSLWYRREGDEKSLRY
jgi:hypothetical protein